MNDLLFTINNVAPVFLIILIGYFLEKMKIINEDFINISSKIVFNIAFPCLIFKEISRTDFFRVTKIDEIIFAALGILSTFIFSYLIAIIFIRDKNKLGVFIQGSFRGNYATIGLALLTNIYGNIGLQKGSILLSFSLPLFNIFAIIGLVLPMHKFNSFGIKKILTRIITNPNIIAVIIALIFSYFKIPDFLLNHKIPGFMIVYKTTEYIGAIALPLALLGVGGSLNFKQIKENIFIVISATFLKNIFFPILLTIIAILLGFKNESLVALYLLFAVPTAVTSYIFAKELDADELLAANIVLITTLTSIITVSLGIFIFKITGIIVGVD